MIKKKKCTVFFFFLENGNFNFIAKAENQLRKYTEYRGKSLNRERGH